MFASGFIGVFSVPAEILRAILERVYSPGRFYLIGQVKGEESDKCAPRSAKPGGGHGANYPTL